MEILIGLLIIAVGAFCQSSCYVPINKIKDWSWESYWIVQGVFAWLILPFIGAMLAVPSGHSFFELFDGYGFEVMMTMLFGMLWGVGGLTFGLSMRYLGVALGQSIALGTCAGLGTIMGPVLLNIFFPEMDALSSLTFSVILGVVVTLLGIAIIGVAGSMKASSLRRREEGCSQGFQLPQGFDYRAAGRFHERMFQRRSGLWQRHTLRHLHSRYVQDASRYLPGNSGRIHHQCHLLLLSELQEPHLG